MVATLIWKAFKSFYDVSLANHYCYQWFILPKRFPTRVLTQSPRTMNFGAADEIEGKSLR